MTRNHCEVGRLRTFSQEKMESDTLLFTLLIIKLFLQTHRETNRFFASAAPSERLQSYVLTLTLTGRLSLQEHILTRKHLVYYFRLYL
jgi:hypothetical protein